MLDAQQIESILGRSLTATELANYDLYLNIAVERIEELLCTRIELPADDSGVLVAEARLYAVRPGYTTVYTDVFTGTPTVTVGDVTKEASTYQVRQFDNRNGTWFNSIVFDDELDSDIEEITVSALWGFTQVPYDLQVLIAKAFDLLRVEHSSDDRVKSKKIEDFSVTYKDSASFDQFVESNRAVINKYSLCSYGEVAHGSVCSIY